MKKLFKKFCYVIPFIGLSILSFSSPIPENLYTRDTVAKNGVVAAAHPEAAAIGLDIMKEGGNAIDAAVATAFAIGVLEPHASGIGGGGFMLIRLADSKETIVIDYRETAPDKVKLEDFTHNDLISGAKSIATPGNVAGLLTALKEYGTKSRKDVISPSVNLARNGITVTKNLAGLLQDNYDKLSLFDSTSSIYLKDGFLPYEEGDKIINNDLANTLELIIKNGEKAFYEGKIAEAISNTVKENGGFLSKEDLKNYKVNKIKPVEGTYRGYKIISCPPPSSGGTHIIELLNIMENFNLSKNSFNSPENYHLWTEAMKLVFADRAKYMGDPKFVDIPLEGLLSKEYAKELSKKIDTTKVMKEVTFGEPYKYESGSTTHISVMDKEGNMVAITQTLNLFWGSGLVVPGTGILLNNEMYDFSLDPNSNNVITKGKKPLSSMAPTIVLDPDEKPFISIGSPGSSRIIPAIALTLSNIIDYHMPLQLAIDAPRITQFEKGDLMVEGRIPYTTYKKLEELGHKMEIKNEYDNYFGGVQAVQFDYKNNILKGGADPRRDGQALGY